MTSNFLIGLGGTGAKCVEAFTYLAACGIGPESVWVGLLDQDRSNGNATRTQQLLADYSTLREMLRAPGGVDIGSSCSLLSTRIVQPGGGWAWAPDGNSSQSLARMAGYGGLPAQQQALMQGLFTTAERELTLDEGFRQRPALGAAVTLKNVSASSSIWKNLIEALQASGHGASVRVFLVASIFGGTGASGLPTVARLLREEIQRRNLAERVKLGALLLLPYFSFPPPDAEGGPAIMPDSSAFLMQARGALEYYDGPDLQGVFDRVYVAGSDPLIPLKDYADGGPRQVNPPLFPELLGALAAIDFLHVRPEVSGETVAAAAAPNTAVGWEDLPYAGDGGPEALRRSMGAAIRFAAAWRGIYAPALRGQLAGRLKCEREAWFRRLLQEAGGSALAGDKAQGAIDRTQALFEGFLRWLNDMSRMGAGGDRQLELLDHRLVADASGTLFPRVTDGNFTRLVSSRSGPSLRDVFSSLTYGPVPDEGSGMGRLIAALHGACTNDSASGRQKK